MADINLSPYTAEQQAMDRRRKMAEAMQQQAMNPIEMPTMPGVQISPAAGLAKMLQAYVAKQNLRKADQEQKDYENQVSGETADLLSKMSQYETVPGDIISPAVPADITPAGTDIQENQARKNLIAYNLQNTKDGMRQIPINNAPGLATYEETNMPSSITDRIVKEAEDLPFKTTQDVINKPAVAEVRGANRQVPVLNASFLDSTKPNAYKTGQVKQMLAQYLMQQEAQKQAAALRKQEAEQAIVKFGPEDTAGRIVNGVFKPIVTGTKQPKWEKSSQFDADGKEIMGWVNINAPDIPASFVKGTVKPAMTEAQQLEAELKQYATEVEADKALDENRLVKPFQRLPKGVPIGAKRTGGKTPDGKEVFELNGKKYVGE